MSSGHATDLGVLPLAGPVPYLPDGDRALVELWAGPRPTEVCTWYHATRELLLTKIAREGLIPSSWTGGDCEVVFGYDERPITPTSRGDVVLEIRSRALPGQLKALWVPHWCIVGAWRGETFVPVSVLRDEAAATAGHTAQARGSISATPTRTSAASSCAGAPPSSPPAHPQSRLGPRVSRRWPSALCRRGLARRTAQLPESRTDRPWLPRRNKVLAT